MKAHQIKKEDGWYLVTADASRDELAGPYATFDDLLLNAAKLGIELIPIPDRNRILGTGRAVGSLDINTLFRSGSDWYRVLRHGPKNTTVILVGLNPKESTFESNKEVDAVSVTSLK